MAAAVADISLAGKTSVMGKGSTNSNNSNGTASGKGSSSGIAIPVDSLKKKTIGLMGSVALLINNVTGGAMVVLPATFQEAGWLLPVFVIIGIATLCCICAIMLIEAMTLVPGNNRFQKRLEYTNLAAIYFPPWLYWIVQLVFNLSIMANNISMIVQSVQVMDFTLVALTGYSCALPQFAPEFAFTCSVPGGYTMGGNSPFGDWYLVSLGWVITCILVMPLGFIDLDDNDVVQQGGFFAVIGIVVIWCVLGVTQPGGLENVQAFGGKYESVMGNIMFNFAIISTIPSWVNEKKPSVPIVRSLCISLGGSCALFIALGYCCGAGFVAAKDNETLLNQIYGLGTKIATVTFYLFPACVNLTSIPVQSIMQRYNLKESGVCGKRMSMFIGVVLPWIISIFLYTGSGYRLLVTWSGLILVSSVNFIFPPIMYIIAIRRYGTGPGAIKTCHEQAIFTNRDGTGTAGSLREKSRSRSRSRSSGGHASQGGRRNSTFHHQHTTHTTTSTIHTQMTQHSSAGGLSSSSPDGTAPSGMTTRHSTLRASALLNASSSSGGGGGRRSSAAATHAQAAAVAAAAAAAALGGGGGGWVPILDEASILQSNPAPTTFSAISAAASSSSSAAAAVSSRPRRGTKDMLQQWPPPPTSPPIMQPTSSASSASSAFNVNANGGGGGDNGAIGDGFQSPSIGTNGATLLTSPLLLPRSNTTSSSSSSSSSSGGDGDGGNHEAGATPGKAQPDAKDVEMATLPSPSTVATATGATQAAVGGGGGSGDEEATSSSGGSDEVTPIHLASPSNPVNRDDWDDEETTPPQTEGAGAPSTQQQQQQASDGDAAPASSSASSSSSSSAAATTTSGAANRRSSQGHKITIKIKSAAPMPASDDASSSTPPNPLPSPPTGTGTDMEQQEDPNLITMVTPVTADLDGLSPTPLFQQGRARSASASIPASSSSSSTAGAINPASLSPLPPGRSKSKMLTPLDAAHVRTPSSAVLELTEVSTPSALGLSLGGKTPLKPRLSAGAMSTTMMTNNNNELAPTFPLLASFNAVAASSSSSSSSSSSLPAPVAVSSAVSPSAPTGSTTASSGPIANTCSAGLADHSPLRRVATGGYDAPPAPPPYQPPSASSQARRATAGGNNHPNQSQAHAVASASSQFPPFSQPLALERRGSRASNPPSRTTTKFDANNKRASGRFLTATGTGADDASSAAPPKDGGMTNDTPVAEYIDPREFGDGDGDTSEYGEDGLEGDEGLLEGDGDGEGDGDDYGEDEYIDAEDAAKALEREEARRKRILRKLRRARQRKAAEAANPDEVAKKHEPIQPLTTFTNIPSVKRNPFKFVAWIIALPWNALYYVTVPHQADGSRFQRYWLWTLLSITAWCVCQSFFLIWSSMIICEVTGITYFAFGIFFLGSLLRAPNLYTEIRSFLAGSGDLNRIFSNSVWQMLLCLPFPWFVWSAANGGEAMVVYTGSQTIVMLLLFLFSSFMLIVIRSYDWYMLRPVGVLAAFMGSILIISIWLFEYNYVIDTSSTCTTGSS